MHSPRDTLERLSLESELTVETSTTDRLASPATSPPSSPASSLEEPVWVASSSALARELDGEFPPYSHSLLQKNATDPSGMHTLLIVGDDARDLKEVGSGLGQKDHKANAPSSLAAPTAVPYSKFWRTMSPPTPSPIFGSRFDDNGAPSAAEEEKPKNSPKPSDKANAQEATAQSAEEPKIAAKNQAAKPIDHKANEKASRANRAVLWLLASFAIPFALNMTATQIVLANQEASLTRGVKHERDTKFQIQLCCIKTNWLWRDYKSCAADGWVAGERYANTLRCSLKTSSRDRQLERFYAPFARGGEKITLKAEVTRGYSILFDLALHDRATHSLLHNSTTRVLAVDTERPPLTSTYAGIISKLAGHATQLNADGLFDDASYPVELELVEREIPRLATMLKRSDNVSHEPLELLVSAVSLVPGDFTELSRGLRQPAPELWLSLHIDSDEDCKLGFTLVSIGTFLLPALSQVFELVVFSRGAFLGACAALRVHTGDARAMPPGAHRSLFEARRLFGWLWVCAPLATAPLVFTFADDELSVASARVLFYFLLWLARLFAWFGLGTKQEAVYEPYERAPEAEPTAGGDGDSDGAACMEQLVPMAGLSAVALVLTDATCTLARSAGFGFTPLLAECAALLVVSVLTMAWALHEVLTNADVGH